MLTLRVTFSKIWPLKIFEPGTKGTPGPPYQRS